MARPSRILAYVVTEGGAWQPGRRRGRAAVAPVALHRSGFVRDRLVLAMTQHADWSARGLKPLFVRDLYRGSYRRWLERLLSSRARRNLLALEPG